MSKNIIVTISLNQDIYNKLKEYAYRKYGKRKGAIKTALEEIINKHLTDFTELLNELKKGFTLGPPPKREEIHDRY